MNVNMFPFKYTIKLNEVLNYYIKLRSMNICKIINNKEINNCITNINKDTLIVRQYKNIN